jgi:hypothetical protein
MPGPFLHVGATVQCVHGGRATPTTPNTRVLVGNQPTATTATPWVVAGCPLPPNSGGPCVTAQWTVGTTRVTSNGQPLVISTGSATCTPTGAPLLTVSSQTKATGT